jgi:hypothetical protein
MWRDSILRRAIGGACCLAFLLQTSGCTSWSSQRNPPAQVLSEKAFDLVRVVRNDGSRVDIYQPRVVNDTVTGFARNPSEQKEAETVSVPVADVRYLEVEKFSAGKTILLVAGVGATVLLIAALVSTISIGNIFGDGSDTTTTPTSCPVIYSWDGYHWRLDSGTYGGAVMPALQRADVDNLVYATPDRGVLRLRLANELRQTDYVDALSILAVDHPTGVTVLPDAAGSDSLHTVVSPVAPLAARDDMGRNVLSWVGVSDGIAWESALRERDPANPTELRDGVQLAFRRPADRDSATLVLDVRNTPWAARLMLRLAQAWGRDIQQWYDPATTDSVARAVAPVVYHKAALQVQILVNGVWETRGRVWETGPELAKQVALPLDLSEVTGDTVQIRLESIPNLWQVDYVGMDASTPAPVAVHTLSLNRADRSGGGDVRGLLAAEDRNYLVLEQGAVTELSVRVPVVPPGLARSYLARTTGWYRIHAAETAEPDVVFRSSLARDGASAVAVRLTNQALAALH